MLSTDEIDSLIRLAESKGKSLRKEAENCGFSRHWPLEHMRPEMVQRVRAWLGSFPDRKPLAGITPK